MTKTVDWAEFLDRIPDEDLTGLVDAIIDKWGLRGLLRSAARACAGKEFRFCPGYWPRAVQVLEDARRALTDFISGGAK